MHTLLSRHRGKLVVGTVVGTLLGLGGVASAALGLTTTVTGTISYTATTVAAEVTETVAVDEPAGGVTCTDRAEPAGPATEVGVDVSVSGPGGCTVSATVHNPGPEALAVLGAGLDFPPGPAPTGWSIGERSGDTTVPVGANRTFTATLVAGPDAAGGSLTLVVDLVPVPVPAAPMEPAPALAVAPDATPAAPAAENVEATESVDTAPVMTSAPETPTEPAPPTPAVAKTTTAESEPAVTTTVVPPPTADAVQVSEPADATSGAEGLDPTETAEAGPTASP